MYAFAHIDKTAGSTLKSILRRSFGTRHCDVRVPMAKRPRDGYDHRAVIDVDDIRRVQRVYRNLRGIAGHNVKIYEGLQERCPDLRFFTVLREPVARFRSHFLNRGVSFERSDFDRWSSTPWLQNWQTRMIAGEPSAEKAIKLLSNQYGFVGLTERFDESVLLLGQWLKEPGFRPEYRRVNQYGHKGRPQEAARRLATTTYLDTDEVRAWMREVNTEDLKVYDYVTATLFPKQIAAYEGSLESDVHEFRERQQATEPPVEPLASRILRNYVYKPLSHFDVV
jgi:Sulfotransferase family